MTGKISDYNIGIMDMQTREAVNNRTGNVIAAPENFFTTRIQREVGRSNFGGIFVNRQSTGSDGEGFVPYNRAYGLDANIQLTVNTRLFSFIAGSTSPGEEGTDWAGRVLVNYATNWWNGHVGYTQVGERFNARTSFVPRRGFRKPQARFFLDYQPKRYPWIRRFSPHVTWNAFYDFNGDIETSRAHIHFLEIQPQMGGRFWARAWIACRIVPSAPSPCIPDRTERPWSSRPGFTPGTSGRSNLIGRSFVVKYTHLFDFQMLFLLVAIF